MQKFTHTNNNFLKKKGFPMKYIFIFILLLACIKSYYYGMFEIKEKENKTGGIAIIFLAILGFIFPSILLILLY